MVIRGDGPPVRGSGGRDAVEIHVACVEQVGVAMAHVELELVEGTKFVLDVIGGVGVAQNVVAPGVGGVKAGAAADGSESPLEVVRRGYEVGVLRRRRAVAQ